MGLAPQQGSNDTLQIGSVVGLLGGGQLGRMMAIAASRLGYKVALLSPNRDDPAVAVAHHHIQAGFDDPAGLEALSSQADVVTYELEQLPLEAVRTLAEQVPVLPGTRALEVSQDRIKEKSFFETLDISTAPWRRAYSAAEFRAAVGEIAAMSPGGGAVVLKTAYGGYDGKGQASADFAAAPVDLDATWDSLAGPNEMSAIVEQKLDFEGEASVIVARDRAGRTVCYDPVLNTHRNHILDLTIAPAPLAPETAKKAQSMACRIADALDYVGVLCLELFLMPSGELLANEIAPRPHNSGHWTIDACFTDQFEQLIRAICGLPLGNPARFADARMKNIIGEDIRDISAYLAAPNARLHLYGKEEVRPGRKMGHVTFLSAIGGGDFQADDIDAANTPAPVAAGDQSRIH